MAFKMGMSKEDLSGFPPIPAGVYELQVTQFKPKIAKSGESLNYNLEASIFNNPELATRKVFHPLNTAFAVAIRDFVHACGEKLETIPDPDNEGETLQVMPGTFEHIKSFPDDPLKWGKYLGPLTNKVFKVELAETEYQGKKKNEIRMFFCVVPNCAVEEPDLKHSTNLIKG